MGLNLLHRGVSSTDYRGYCDHCHRVSETMWRGDAGRAARETAAAWLRSLGWVYLSDHTYCPRCVADEMMVPVRAGYLQDRCEHCADARGAVLPLNGAPSR